MKYIIPALFLFFAACSGADMNSQSASVVTELSDDVLTREAQLALTPDQILKQLQEGNERFVNNNLTPRDLAAQVSKTADGQYPKAVVVSCLDSRVPVEHVFDQGVGDIFVGRVAGNFVNEDMLGSLEFATAVAGSKVILVVGHSQCGAVKAAIDDVQLGNITAMLSKIKPAVEQTANGFDGEATSANDTFVTGVVNNNVLYTIGQIRERSPIIAGLEQNGDVVIAGAFYDLETGRVTMLD
jgi:carbonic anhydrase